MNQIQSAIVTRAERERWLHAVAEQEKRRSRMAWRAWIAVGVGWSIGVVVGLMLGVVIS